MWRIGLAALTLTACAGSPAAEPVDTTALLERVDELEAENERLRGLLAAAPEPEPTVVVDQPVEQVEQTVEPGTRTNPIPLGQPAAVGGGWTVTVVGVDFDATESVMLANPFNSPPADGNVYVVVTVSATYAGVEESDTAGVHFRALGASNVSLDQGGSTFAVPPDPTFPVLTETFQGGTIVGNVLFEVPLGDLADLVIIGHALTSIDQGERAFFALR